MIDYQQWREKKIEHIIAELERLQIENNFMKDRLKEIASDFDNPHAKMERHRQMIAYDALRRLEKSE